MLYKGPGEMDRTPERSAHFEPTPDLKVRERDTKLSEMLRREFRDLKRKEEDLKFLIVGTERDVSFTRGWNTNPENFTFVETTPGKARFLNKRGYKSVKKENPEKYEAKKEGEGQADIVAVWDEEMSAGWRFLKSVAPKGYLLCRIDMATGALRTNKFNFMGCMSVRNNAWSFVESSQPEMVENDMQFRNAPPVKSTVSYNEARDILVELGRPTDNVFKEYQDLIEEAIAQNEEAAKEDGQTTLSFTNENGHTVDHLNTTFPPQKGSDKDIYVLRKHENV